MAKIADELMQFSSADGELRLDGSSKTAEELLKIAVEAAASGRRLVIGNITTKEMNLLQRMARAGKGNVLFDLR